MYGIWPSCALWHPLVLHGCHIRTRMHRAKEVHIGFTPDQPPQKKNSPVSPVHFRHTISKLWKAVCGEQESLSYCEFLAVLLPPMEDVFEDASQVIDEINSPLQPREHWNPSRSVSNYFPQMKRSPNSFFPQALIFDEDKQVIEVVSEMARFHRRWALIRFKENSYEFFDYVDINHRLLEDIGSNGSAADCLSRICQAKVGSLANCSGFCVFKAWCLVGIVDVHLVSLVGQWDRTYFNPTFWVFYPTF